MSQIEKKTALIIEADEELLRYCDDKGYKIQDGTVEDVLTGKCEKPEIVILRDKTDITSDVNEYYSYLFLLKERGVSIIALHDSFGTASMFEPILDKFVDTLHGFCNKYPIERDITAEHHAERDTKAIAEKMMQAREEKARKGGYAGGGAATGYHSENGELVKNVDEAPVVRYIFSKRKHDWTLTEIANGLNSEGYKTKRGKTFSPAQVSTILKNDMFYKGYLKMKDGTWVKGEHEPYLDEEGNVLDDTDK